MKQYKRHGRDILKKNFKSMQEKIVEKSDNPIAKMPSKRLLAGALV